MKNKIDVAIINPPYLDGMHNKFFIQTFETLKDEGIMTCVHPSNYALTKSKRINRFEYKVREIVQNYESTIEFIDGNSYFKNAHFFGPLCITTVIKKKNTAITVKNTHLSKQDEVIHDINKIYIHGQLHLVNSIVEKVKSKHLDSFHTKNTKFDKSGPCFLKLPTIIGHSMKNGKPNPDFSCLIYKQDQYSYTSIFRDDFAALQKGRGLNILNKEYAINAFSFMKEKFCRFMLSTEKTGPNVWNGTSLKAIPYLDFSRNWTSSEIYEFFNLTIEEIGLIETYIEDYYESDFK